MATLSPSMGLPFPSTSNSNSNSNPASNSPTHSPSRSPILTIPRSGSYSLASPTPSQRSFNLIPPTRCLAILMGSCAKVHRLAIQSRLTSSGFEILTERLENWTMEDIDFLSEFLAQEKDQETVDRLCRKLTANPLYVMVIERSNCVETWWSLIGEDKARGGSGLDGEDEEEEDLTLDANGLPIPKKGTTLRSTYGDLFYGSPSSQAAERQIGLGFPEIASPAALKALANEGFNTLFSSNEKKNEIMLNSEDIVWDDQGFAYDSRTGEPLDLQEEYSYSQPMTKSPSGNSYQVNPNSAIFRARPLPASHKKASIQPRMSRAAALRMGIELPKVPRRTVSDATSQGSGSERDKGQIGISGVKKSEVPVPKSLAKPTLGPRMNKAAAARMGIEVETSAPVREKRPVDFSVTPGHKRASTGIQLASLAAPTIAPRQNKASQARTGGGSPEKALGGPAKERKPVDFSNTPGHRRLSTGPKPSSLAAPTIKPRSNRAASARGGRVEGELPSGMTTSSGTDSPSRQRLSSAPSHGKSSSALGCSIKSVLSEQQQQQQQRARKEVDFSNTPGHRRLSISSIPIASLSQPSILPRANNASNARLRRGSVGSLGEFENLSNPSQYPNMTSNVGSVKGGSRPSSRISVNSEAHQDGMTPPSSSRKRVGGSTAPPSSYRHSIIGMPRPPSRG